MNFKNESQLLQELATALALVETYKTNSARYRYMRNNAAFRDKNGPGLYWYLPRWIAGGAAERIDASVDAAMSESDEVEGK